MKMEQLDKGIERRVLFSWTCIRTEPSSSSSSKNETETFYYYVNL